LIRLSTIAPLKLLSIASRQVQNQTKFNGKLQDSLQSKIQKIEEETEKYNAAVRRLEDLRDSTLTMEQRHATVGFISWDY
jgi:uncharacterized protein YukE